MMYHLAMTASARDDLHWFRKYDQQQIVTVIETQLVYQPGEATQQRKHLRPNRLAVWELRAGSYRIFYDIMPEDMLVAIVAIGYKNGNRLYIRGKEYVL